MRLVLALVLMFLCNQLHAQSVDGKCYWEPLQLTTQPTKPKPKATMVGPSLSELIKRPPKPKVKKYKTFPLITNGYVFLCDDDKGVGPPELIPPTTFDAPPLIVMEPPAVTIESPPASVSPPPDYATPPTFEAGPPMAFYSPPESSPPACEVCLSPPLCPPMPIPAIPEVPTYWMLALGLLGLVGWRIRR